MEMNIMPLYPDFKLIFAHLTDDPLFRVIYVCLIWILAVKTGQDLAEILKDRRENHDPQI